MFGAFPETADEIRKRGIMKIAWKFAWNIQENRKVLSGKANTAYWFRDEEKTINSDGEIWEKGM